MGGIPSDNQVAVFSTVINSFIFTSWRKCSTVPIMNNLEYGNGTIVLNGVENLRAILGDSCTMTSE